MVSNAAPFDAAMEQKMNARLDHSPIRPSSPDPRPHDMRTFFPERLEPAIVGPSYEGMDDTSEWAQTYRPAKPADRDDVFSQDEDAEEVRELLANRPAPTPNGKYVGIAMDACAALFEIVQSCRVPENYDVFSEVDVDKWAAICQRAGYSL
jgi:hypothetical protein